MEKNEEQANQLLTWIQKAISSEQLRDSSRPGVQRFNAFLKKHDLLPFYLHKIGVVFAVIEHNAKNLSKAMTIAGQALKHNPNNNTSPAQNYTIVNYYRRGENQPNKQSHSNSLTKTSHIDRLKCLEYCLLILFFSSIRTHY
jgi:hypothetical protein